MVYMGSKSKIAKYIVPILQRKIDEVGATVYVEPFVGGANVIDKIKCERRIGYDRSDTLIALLCQARDDFSKVLADGNRELWDKGKGYIKDGVMPEDMTLAEIGAMEFFASFSNGGFPRGYAKLCLAEIILKKLAQIWRNRHLTYRGLNSIKAIIII